jgi:hypothetical protein
MALRRRYDQRPLVGGGPRFQRAFLVAIGTAATIGLLLGVIWVIAGILHFHPLG